MATHRAHFMHTGALGLDTDLGPVPEIGPGQCQIRDGQDSPSFNAKFLSDPKLVEFAVF